jgi:hypothetical protein
LLQQHISSFCIFRVKSLFLLQTRLKIVDFHVLYGQQSKKPARLQPLLDQLLAVQIPPCVSALLHILGGKAVQYRHVRLPNGKANISFSFSWLCLSSYVTGINHEISSYVIKSK